MSGVIDDDLWFELFKPQQNHLVPNASWGGVMYETYGAEQDYILAQPTQNVWTWVDCDGGTALVSGFAYVNRLGYFVCEVGMADLIEISISRDCDDCDEADDGLCEACAEEAGEEQWSWANEPSLTAGERNR